MVEETSGNTESISVFIPFRGSGPELRRQVSVVAGQIDPTIDEVIVVLNGESPENESWLTTSGLTGVRVVHALERAGASYARNIGATHARGKIVAFTDADDIVQPGWISGIRSVFASNRYIHAVVGSQRNRVDGVSPSSSFRPPVTLPGGHLLMQTNNLAVLRETFEQLRGFDEALPYCEDRDFSFRFTDAGFEDCYAENVQIDRYMPHEIRRAARKQANYTWWGHVVNQKHGRRGRSRLPRALAAVCVRAPYVATRSRMGRSMLGSTVGVIIGELTSVNATLRFSLATVWRIPARE
ncbi:MAG: glycosyltransferase family 2 protein, partial [Actinomycetota bacterium]